jgi:arylsulfatase A-like enzyme
MRWPGVTKAGSTCGTPTIHVDLPATFLEMTGAPAPDQARDGESLVALLKDPAAALKRTAIYQHMPGYLGAGKGTWRTTPVGVIQQGDWKLMEFFEDGRLELYDLASDLGETKNLASANPDKTAELHTKLKAWRAETGAAMPTPNHGASTGSAKETGAKKKGEGKGKGKGKGKAKTQAEA